MWSCPVILRKCTLSRFASAISHTPRGMVIRPNVVSMPKLKRTSPPTSSTALASSFLIRILSSPMYISPKLNTSSSAIQRLSIVGVPTIVLSSTVSSVPLASNILPLICCLASAARAARKAASCAADSN